jgi:hypothetical protein
VVSEISSLWHVPHPRFDTTPLHNSSPLYGRFQSALLSIGPPGVLATRKGDVLFRADVFDAGLPQGNCLALTLNWGERAHLAASNTTGLCNRLGFR